METLLTPEQKSRLRVALLEQDRVRNLLTPLERHQFVLKYNWDEGYMPINWIAKQPDTDKGTIHLIYWTNGPRYLHQFTDKNVDSLCKEGYRLCKLIEQNIENKIYKTAQIHFDPKTSGPSDYTKDYLDKEIVTPIPEEMYQIVQGTFIKDQVLEERIERFVYPSVEQMEEIQKKVKKGFNILKKLNFEVAEGASPMEIIQTLQKVIESYTLADPIKVPDKKEKVTLRSLDFLWAEQVVRVHGWQWVMKDSGYPDDLTSDPALISPDKIFYWNSNHNYPMWGLATPTPKFPMPALTEHFHDVGDIEGYKKKVLGDAYVPNAVHTNIRVLEDLPKGIWRISKYIQKP